MITRRRAILALLVFSALASTYGVLLLVLGLPRPGFLTSLITISGFTGGLLHASLRLGWKRALVFLGLVFVVSLGFESVGVATGMVYGPYHYTEKLGPKFLGLVPYLIAIAWFMMMYPSYVISDRLLGERFSGWRRFLLLAAIGGLVMTSWDVVMDPMMVLAGNWVWDVEGAYFGVPLQNYFGWWLTVFTTFALYLFLMGDQRILDEKPFDRLSLVAYVVTAIGNTVVAFLVGLHGPVLAGLFAMLPWLVLGWLSMQE